MPYDAVANNANHNYIWSRSLNGTCGELSSGESSEKGRKHILEPSVNSIEIEWYDR